ncbi:MAG TPA: hypothetical protein VGT44_20385 [Ktedonobacteraceae bacterium]|nr:hypothetical protein [Ktedonobacteraceae bacterium]
MSEILSDVAYFRKQQALSEEAALLGLTGFAITATHESITARMERCAARILCLIDEGRHEEAQAILNTDSWYADDQACTGEQTGIPTGKKARAEAQEHEPA